MEESKSSLGSAELPTGVLLESGEVVKQVTFRELAGPEEDILASNSMPVSQKITQILANCTVELGNIKEQPEIRKLVDKIVITDRWFYLIELRSLSFGQTYATETECPECKRKDKVMIDLKELEITKPPDAKSLFNETTLPSGHVVRWKVADGLTELRIEKTAKENNRATVGLFARCTEFDSKPVTINNITSLSMKERHILRKDIDEKEGDFDDKYKATCPGCGHEYEGQVRLEPESFFFP